MLSRRSISADWFRRQPQYTMGRVCRAFVYQISLLFITYPLSSPSLTRNCFFIWNTPSLLILELVLEDGCGCLIFLFWPS
ncbi:hypothetical protein B0T24DRAFT_44415 [Lasiosphaeria ovina]|uniref:Uncharacterized protein n=1 Tax=Lasiosphaeria ovina TaxID=92902 RepID=A0AAE0NKN7_9PEZI|nr:hypothetical protein B0T24DRAFT_44415 [Lasiosphaeria ovina]